MQVPQPLAVGNISSPAGNILEIPRIDQAHFQPTGFQDLEQRNPIDTGGLHRYRFDSARLEPVCQPMEIFRECGECSHRFGISVGGTATKISVAPMSTPAALGRKIGNSLVPRAAFIFRFFARDMVRSPRLDVTAGGGPGRAFRYSPKRDHQLLGEARRWRHHCSEHGTRNHACITGFNGSTDAAVSTVAARGLPEMIHRALPVFHPVVTYCGRSQR